MADGKLFTGNDRFCKVVAPVHHLLAADAGLCKWPQRRITYFEIMSLKAPGFDIHAIYDEAWRQWEAVCDIEPIRIVSATDANVWASQGSIDGPWGTLAYSYLPCGSSADTQLTQLYDDGETWTYPFLLACACHEIGHALGLNHLGVGNLMAPILDEAITKPQPGDIAEIVARYGPPGVVPTPTPTPVPTPTPTPALIPGDNLAVDGMWRVYTLGAAERRYPFHVPPLWFSNRRWFNVSAAGSSITPTITLYGKLGKVLARGDEHLRIKLYAGDYSVGIQDSSGRGGPFRMMAKFG